LLADHLAQSSGSSHVMRNELHGKNLDKYRPKAT